MSIQGNVNQLLTMAGTAAMLSPQLRQKTEDTAKLRKLEKEESSILKIQENESEATKKPEAIEKRRKIMDYRAKLEKGEALSDIEKMEYEALDKEFAAGQEARNERRDRIFEIANERAELNPSAENIEEARKLRNSKSWTEVLQKKGKVRREEALRRMQELGRDKAEQKSEFDKFRESLDKDDPFLSLSSDAQKAAYEQYKKGGK